MVVVLVVVLMVALVVMIRWIFFLVWSQLYFYFLQFESLSGRGG